MNHKGTKTPSGILPFTKVLDSRGAPVRGLWQRASEFFAQYRDPRKASPVRKKLEGCQSVAEARRALEKLRVEVHQRDLPALGRAPRLREFVDDYFASLPAGAKRPATLKKQRGHLALWVEKLGGLRLDEITEGHIEDFIAARRAAGMSGRTCDLDVGALRVVLNRAQRRHHLKTLPTKSYEPMAEEPPERPLWTWTQIEQLCAVAVARCANGQDLAELIRLLAFSGLRVSEALRLSVTDINWDLSYLGIDRRSKGGYARRVDLNPELEAHLREMLKRQAPDVSWLFPSPYGDKPVKSYEHSLQKARELAGLPDFQFHDLRHYFISRCVMAGIDFMTIAKWAGHKDGGVLIGKVYGHLADEHRKRMAARLHLGPQIFQAEFQQARR